MFNFLGFHIEKTLGTYFLLCGFDVYKGHICDDCPISSKLVGFKMYSRNGICVNYLDLIPVINIKQ